MKKILILPLFMIVLAGGYTLSLNYRKHPQTSEPAATIVARTKATPAPTAPLPPQKILSSEYHVFQTFNNCGPASLSMALTYYGINKSQNELGNELRPYQVPNGNNDDKSVTLEEMAAKAEEYGLAAIHRPAGNIGTIKHYIHLGYPVITRTWLAAGEDIGHYRVVKGYDDINQRLLQDDSLQGKNIYFTYDEFDTLWKKFNYEYLVLVPENEFAKAQSILGPDADLQTAWRHAVQTAQNQLAADPNDKYARFNLSVALYHAGDYQGAVREFEAVENSLPKRTLWYQIEPIQAYYELGDYQRVLDMTQRILNGQNRAFSELYLIRGNIYENEGENARAQGEYQKAVIYNSNFTDKVPQLL